MSSFCINISVVHFIGKNRAYTPGAFITVQVGGVKYGLSGDPLRTKIRPLGIPDLWTDGAEEIRSTTIGFGIEGMVIGANTWYSYCLNNALYWIILITYIDGK